MQRIPVIQGGVDLSTISSQATSRANPSVLPCPSPLIQMQPPQALQTSHLSQPSQKFILVIDDSATVRKIIETCLGRENFVVRGFSDGVEAMRWLTTPESRIPDLVWLDIGLPKMDGYEVARRLKTKPQFANTVLVMLSRRDGVMDRLKGRLAGAKTYMTKPFKTQDIVSVTKSLLGIAPSEQEALL
jgi:DNA-binding response OmpR family regulator